MSSANESSQYSKERSSVKRRGGAKRGAIWEHFFEDAKEDEIHIRCRECNRVFFQLLHLADFSSAF